MEGSRGAVDLSLALGFVPAAIADPATPLQIEMLGELRDATIHATPLHDPSGGRMRS